MRNMANSPEKLNATAESSGARLDQFLTSQLPDSSRARVQRMIAEEKILVNGARAKASLRLQGDEL